MRALLLLCDRLAGPIGSLGIDYRRFRAILAVKLTLDRRRQHAWVQGTKRLAPFTWSLIIHGAMGLWLAALTGVVASPLTALTLGLSVVMLMLTFDLVADYSSLLLDSTEARVLAARPVDPRTLLAARVVHVGAYLGMYVAAMAAATCVAGSWRWGIAFLPAYLLSLLASVVLVLAAVTIVYLLIMRVVSTERVRDATLWAQLGMTVITAAGYYLVSTIDFRGGGGIEESAWIYLYPPAWMAGLPALVSGRAEWSALVLAALGLLVPVLVARIAISLSPRFRVADTDDEVRARVRVRASWSSRAASVLGRWTTPSKAARAAFELVWTLAARDRPFKTRTYPALLSVVLFVVAFGVLARSGVWAAQIGDMAQTNMHLFLLYYGILVIPTPILMAPYADHPEAAWIYRGMPIDRPGTVLVAALQVLFIRMILPVFLAIAMVVLAIWGGRVIVDIALAFATTRLVTFCFAMVAGRRLPFSAPPPGGASGTTAGAVIGGMGMVLALGAGHRLLLGLDTPLAQPWPVVVAIPIVLLLAHVAARACAATRWSDV
jgi:hypothetical protein